jgi:hypothetical protein
LQDTGPLELPRDVLQQGIILCPDAYLLNPQQNYEQAIRAAPKQYQDPVQFRNLLLSNPAVLRCTYNCADTGCNSECGNCWVSFQYQASEQTAALANASVEL